MKTPLLDQKELKEFHEWTKTDPELSPKYKTYAHQFIGEKINREVPKEGLREKMSEVSLDSYSKGLTAPKPSLIQWVKGKKWVLYNESGEEMASGITNKRDILAQNSLKSIKKVGRGSYEVKRIELEVRK